MEEHHTTPEERAALIYARELLRHDFGVAESLSRVKRKFGRDVDDVKHIMFTALYIHITEPFSMEENTAMEFEPYSAGGYDLMCNSALILGKKL